MAWACLLLATVGLGLLGRTGVAPAAVVRASTPPPAAATAGAGTVGRPPDPVTSRQPARSLATRPPIGEDGVMGGLVFGTAWGWLDAAEPDR